jgi:hypothetical protein
MQYYGPKVLFKIISKKRWEQYHNLVNVIYASIYALEANWKACQEDAHIYYKEGKKKSSSVFEA